MRKTTAIFTQTQTMIMKKFILNNWCVLCCVIVMVLFHSVSIMYTLIPIVSSAGWAEVIFTPKFYTQTCPICDETMCWTGLILLDGFINLSLFKGRCNKFHWVCSFIMVNSINKGIAPLSVKIDPSVPDRLVTVIQFLRLINSWLFLLQTTVTISALKEKTLLYHNFN